jgi:predicted RNase H-like HicB family nuclease
MLQDRYIYPAIFTYAEDGITVEFPDLPGCITEGDTEQESLSMARDALSLRLFTIERESGQVPVPSKANQIAVQDEQVVVLIDVWMPPFRHSMLERAVKKTVTIPRWLDDLAQNEAVNFSLVLQEGLKKSLGIIESDGPSRGIGRSQALIRHSAEGGSSKGHWFVSHIPSHPSDGHLGVTSVRSRLKTK